MKAGILYPRSAAHPGLLPGFMEGIRTSLLREELSDTIRLLGESVGFGGNEKEVYEKAEKLLVLEGVDILVAFIDLRVLDLLKPLVYSSGKRLLVVNPGANYLQDAVPDPQVLHLTLNQAFLCWQAGKNAAAATGENGSGHNGQQAALATSFYDCGYLHSTAMVNGYLQGGGTVIHYYINKDRADTGFGIPELTQYLEETPGIRKLLCLYDEQPAALFYQRLAEYPGAAGMELYVSPMMLTEKALAINGKDYPYTITGYAPWLPGQDDSASLYEVMGREAGLVLSACYREGGIPGKGGIPGEGLESPRGLLSLDPDSNYFTAPFWRCRQEAGSGQMQTERVEWDGAAWQQFLRQAVEGPSSGWNNTYLCY